MRNRLAHLDADLAAVIELERRLQQHVLIAELKRLDFAGMRLPVAFREFRFRFEQVHLRWTTVLEELNYGPCPARRMAFPRREIIGNGIVGQLG